MRGLSERKKWEPRSVSDTQIPGRVRNGIYWVSQDRALMPERNMDRIFVRRGPRTVMCSWPEMPAPGILAKPGRGASSLTGNGASTGRPESGGG